MGLLSFLFGRPKPPIVISPAPAYSPERAVADPQAKRVSWRAGSFPMEVVGESNYQAAFSKICGKHSREGHELEVDAELTLEPANAYDPDAVLVTVGGQKVGYVGRDQNKRVGAAIRDAGVWSVRCGAQIRGGWRTNQHDEGHFGIRLAVPNRGPIDLA